MKNIGHIRAPWEKGSMVMRLGMPAMEQKDIAHTGHHQLMHLKAPCIRSLSLMYLSSGWGKGILVEGRVVGFLNQSHSLLLITYK